MKTKIASFLTAAILSVLSLTSASFADTEEGFYEKDHIRGFISVGADYRGMRSEFQRYVNSTAFVNKVHIEQVEVPNEEGDVDTVLQEFYGNFKYSKFNDYYLGFHVNVGAQYKQFLTWFDINFMPSQVSKRPKAYYTATSAGGASSSHPLYDVEWFTYGVDWMFGWKLFGEDTFINLIPSAGFGFNLINFHLASDFTLVNKDDIESREKLRDRFYSTMATTVNAELELRIELGRFALGGYGGYRFVRYNELEAEGFKVNNYINNTDNVGDTWFLGARATWYFLSDWEKKQANKL